MSFEGSIVSLVVVVSRNGVIGRDNGMPWRLSTDLRRFKAITMGHPIVMGRRTWHSFPRRPLPGRANIVITRDAGFAEEGAIVAHGLTEALEIAVRSPGGDEICVIGGGQIFAEVLPYADRLYVTHIEADIAGDTFFPPIDASVWQAGQAENVPAGEKDDHPTRFVVYERR